MTSCCLLLLVVHAGPLDGSDLRVVSHDRGLGVFLSPNVHTY